MPGALQVAAPSMKAALEAWSIAKAEAAFEEAKRIHATKTEEIAGARRWSAWLGTGMQNLPQITGNEKFEPTI